MEEVIIYTDGGSRSNPGPAASAYIIKDSTGRNIEAKGFFLGEATNNFAEYTAVVKGLAAAKELDAKGVKLYSDSEFLIKQIKGHYKVKSENIKDLYAQVMELLAGFGKWSVTHIYREKNTEADALVNRVLDTGKDIAMRKIKEVNKKKIKLAVLISGGGTTMMNILDCINKGQLDAEISVVISSRSEAGGVEKAKKAGLNVEIVRKKDYQNIDDLSAKIEEIITKAKVELVVQAGWLCLWKIPKKYTNRVMNIHPALLPSFGGQGMWGHYVHEAVLEHGCKISGCTVHFCTNEYDKGPIIVQRSCPVAENDTPDTLAARVFKEECEAYPKAIQLFADGKVIVKNNKAVILP
jgi:phosphoribosylglycinamide formyltransferase-1